MGGDRVAPARPTLAVQLYGSTSLRRNVSADAAARAVAVLVLAERARLSEPALELGSPVVASPPSSGKGKRKKTPAVSTALTTLNAMAMVTLLPAFFDSRPEPEVGQLGARLAAAPFGPRGSEKGENRARPPKAN